MSKLNILAICGSTRAQSTNLSLIKAIKHLFLEQLEIEIYSGLSELPHFNPDLNDTKEVSLFKDKIKAASGVLICTPEYAMGVPGSLKNALDWTVASMEFSQKPVLLITASSSGEKAHTSLLETLKVIEAIIPEECQLLISYAKTKIKNDEITDDITHSKVVTAVNAFTSLLHQE
ncbi:MAG: NAD(P)H-dependent oxidoreductase [Saprospiraceae bacterium]|nr:NAD(P)H-dependent oxidoreductase [Saprospiraceae bacterium]MBK8633321.1 NAD(P)H-dependent oxidoreductase [Saprospiraceae bacterium]MBP7643056.1 NAD(P)H-dependent oxidoreductase [Saprospiraceae bacterium]